jgi:hypothetical protein
LGFGFRVCPGSEPGGQEVGEPLTRDVLFFTHGERSFPMGIAEEIQTEDGMPAVRAIEDK